MVLTFLFTLSLLFSLFFFFHDTATTEIYTLSLHDALPISVSLQSAEAIARAHAGLALVGVVHHLSIAAVRGAELGACPRDRKSTRLNSSHLGISYAVFCLKKKKKKKNLKHRYTIHTLENR